MGTPTVFIVKNQAGLFLNKQQEWVEGGDRQTLYRTAHRDEAVNTVFEVSSKDVYLRAEVVACPVDSKGQPLPQGADLLTEAELPTEESISAQEEASDQYGDELIDSGTPETTAASVETPDINA